MGNTKTSRAEYYRNLLVFERGIRSGYELIDKMKKLREEYISNNASQSVGKRADVPLKYDK